MISPPTGCSSAWLERCVWDAEVRRFESGHPDSGYHGSVTTSRLVAVTVGGGLVVWHTREEWDTLMRGVDREAVDALSVNVDEFVARQRRR
jgi:hypothetical protein